MPDYCRKRCQVYFSTKQINLTPFPAVEAGLEADLLVFDRNPLQQPTVLHNALVVISNGRIGLNRHVGAARVLPNH
jgi:hypothetical protein